MTMSQDVEIIEVDPLIIEISDDEEDCKDFLVIDEVLEVQNEVIEVNESTQTPATRHAGITRALNNARTRSHSAFTENEVQEAIQNVLNIRTESPFPHEIKQEVNNADDINSIIGQECNSSLNAPVCNRIGNNQTSKRKRTKNRGRKRNKNFRECIRDAATCNGNNDSEATQPVIEEDTFTSNTVNVLDSYALSKLKWLKPLNNLSSPPHLQIVIIDRNDHNWRIATDKWLMVEKRLLEALNREMLRTNDPSIGLFDGAKWQRGIKVIGCHNENAFDFIMKFISSLDKLWNGAKLYAFPISNLTRYVVRAYIPPPIIKTDLIMSLIKLQNPSINTSDWKILRESERIENGGIDIWISINVESYNQLSLVRGEIKFGINRIFLNPSR